MKVLAQPMLSYLLPFAFKEILEAIPFQFRFERAWEDGDLEAVLGFFADEAEIRVVLPTDSFGARASLHGEGRGAKAAGVVPGEELQHRTNEGLPRGRGQDHLLDAGYGESTAIACQGTTRASRPERKDGVLRLLSVRLGGSREPQKVAREAVRR